MCRLRNRRMPALGLLLVKAIFPHGGYATGLIGNVATYCEEVAGLECVGLGTPPLAGKLGLDPAGILAQCQCSMSRLVEQMICSAPCNSCPTSCTEVSPVPTPYRQVTFPPTHSRTSALYLPETWLQAVVMMSASLLLVVQNGRAPTRS